MRPNIPLYRPSNLEFLIINEAPKALQIEVYKHLIRPNKAWNLGTNSPEFYIYNPTNSAY